MPEHKNNTWTKGWDHWSNQQRLSLEDFLAFIQEYLALITITRENLQSAYFLLKEREKIQQDQFNYIIGLAHSMESSVQELSLFLDQRSRLPIAILPLRHQLTTKLLTLKELLWAVLALAGSLHSMRAPDPKESAMTRHKLSQKLDALLQESDNMEKLAQIFSDQAYFQENKNRNMLNRTSLARDKEHNNSDDWNIYDISLYRFRAHDRNASRYTDTSMRGSHPTGE